MADKQDFAQAIALLVWAGWTEEEAFKHIYEELKKREEAE